MFTAANDDAEDRVRISEQDLDGYIDGTLSRRRRRVVEGYLACNPDLAAQVMTRMHMSAERPQPRRRRNRFGTAVALIAGLMAGLGSGVGLAAAHLRDVDGWRTARGGDPPAYVEDAAESREASQLRERMVSQVETPKLDAVEIRQTLRVPLPRLPVDWRIKDVQVFPTDDGPSVNLVVETGAGRRLELFAVRAEAVLPSRPQIATRGREAVAYWQRGAAAYVLAGPQSAPELLANASVLARESNL